RKNAEHEVVIPRDTIGAPGAGRPYLGRDELDELRFPVPEHALFGGPPDGAGKAEIELAIIDADDDVRLAASRCAQQLLENPAEFEVMLENTQHTDHRKPRQVVGDIDAGGFHVRASGAEEARGQSGSQ